MSDKNKEVAARLTAALLQSGHNILLDSRKYKAESVLEPVDVVDIYMEFKNLLDHYEKDY